MKADTVALRKKFEAAGQGHVFAHWEGLDERSREQLVAQAAEIDLKETRLLFETLVEGDAAAGTSLEGLAPAPYEAHPDHGGDAARWAAMKAKGEDALRAGRVAAFVVAGGQGTRLGYDGPKGTFPVTPVKEKPLFQVFAEKIRAAQTAYDCTIPWFIMTSHANHAPTVAAFEEAGFWGLDRAQVHFFAQGRMAAVDAEGKIILEAKDAIAMNPDGHGGSLRALVRNGAVETMREAGIDTISYFQVDNPLVQVIDPVFIGFHLAAQSDMSSKMVPKAYPLEKLGMFCEQDGKVIVIEYSDMPEAMQEETDDTGALRYNAGSIAIHILARDFVAKVGSGEEAFALPFHRAHKKVPALQPDGTTASPEQPNGFKFEMFVFDALPYAQHPVIIETSRADDFSPVKNAEGQDSPQTSRDDQIRQWVRWLRAAGETVETDETGLPSFALEVSPLFADREDVFVQKWQGLEAKPSISDGLYLE
ncbi:MAG: UTP--glucose-1-phosphate uridylyltransferase [Opitutales bacterium]